MILDPRENSRPLHSLFCRSVRTLGPSPTGEGKPRSRRALPRATPILPVAAWILACGPVSAADGVWTNPAGGSWGNAANWASGTIAGDVYSTADFSTVDLTADRTITLDGGRNCWTLILGDLVPSHDWTITNGTGGPLAFTNGARIEVVNGTADIRSPLDGWFGLTKIGAGTLRLSAVGSLGGHYARVEEGTLELAARNGNSGTLAMSEIRIDAGAAVVASEVNALGTSGNNWVRSIKLWNGASFTTTAQGDQGWGVEYDLIAGTLRASGRNARFTAGGGTKFIARGNETSTIHGRIQLREGNPSNLLSFEVSDGASDIDIDVAGTIEGTVAGRGARKWRGGTMRLSVGTMLGPFHVDDGRLLVDRRISCSRLDVAATGTLGGVGSVNAPVTIAGTLAPGDLEMGTLSLTEPLTLQTGATLRLRLGSVEGAPTSDRLSSTVPLTLGGSLVVELDGDEPRAGDTFTLIAAPRLSGSFASIQLPELSEGRTWDDSGLQSSGVLRVNGSPQSITFPEIPEAILGTVPPPLVATASSGLPVVFESSDPSIATVSGNTLTLVGSGYAKITASQPGDADFLPADPVERTLTVNRADRVAQSIDMPPLDPVDRTTVTVPLVATSSQGLPVTFISSNPAVATINGTLAIIHGAGTTLITARQPGNTDVLPADNVVRELVVTGTSQTIDFPAIPVQLLGNRTTPLAATASSGLEVSYTSSDPAIASVSGNVVTLHAAGSVVVTARQPGDAVFDPAPEAQRTLEIVDEAAALSLLPAAPTLNLRSNESGTLEITLENQSPGELGWTAVVTAEDGRRSSLEQAVQGIADHADQLTGAIPKIQLMDGGNTGTFIDGTTFIQGNRLSTDLGGPLEYTGGEVVDSAGFGDGGRYFTRKLPGLFLLGADVRGVGEFRIEGTAWKGMARQSRSFEIEVGDRRWSAVMSKIRCYDRYTVNHLILADRPGMADELADQRSDQGQTVSLAPGTTRLYYALFTTREGEPDVPTFPPPPPTRNADFVADETFEELARLILESVPPAIDSRFRLEPAEGRTATGTTTLLNLVADATDAVPGGHPARLEIRNGLDQLVAQAPISLHVEPAVIEPDQRSIGILTVPGTVPQTREVALVTVDGTPRPWTAEVPDAPAWLTLETPSGTTPEKLSFTVSQEGLASGHHRARILVRSGDSMIEIPVVQTVDTLDVRTLRPDFSRNRLYAANAGHFSGSVLVVSPVDGSVLSVVPVGKGACDLSISPDASRLYVAEFDADRVSEIDLGTLTRTRRRDTILRKGGGGRQARRFHISAGPRGRVFHSDGAAEPDLIVLDFDSGEAISSFSLGRFDGIGAMWFDPMEDQLYFQEDGGTYGGNRIGILDVSADEPVLLGVSTAPIPSTVSTNPLTKLDVGLNRDFAFADYTMVDLNLRKEVGNRLPSNVRASSPYADQFVGRGALHDAATRSVLLSLPETVDIVEFTPDLDALIHFKKNESRFARVPIPEAVRPRPIGLAPTPASGTVLSLAEPILRWSHLPLVEGYRLYIGNDAAEVASAAPGAPSDQGVILDNFYDVAPFLDDAAALYWRIDALRGATVIPGPVFEAIVPGRKAVPEALALRVPQSITPRRVSFQIIDRADQPVAWTLVDAPDWFVTDASSGTAGDPFIGSITPGSLDPGKHEGTVTLGSGPETVEIPIRVETYTPVVAKMLAHPGGGPIYALHTGDSFAAESQILEIDPATGDILEAMPVGRNAIDFEIDPSSGWLFANNLNQTEIHRIDLETRTPLDPLPAEDDITGIEPFRDGMIFTQRSTSYFRGYDVIDGTTGEVLTNSGTHNASGSRSEYDPASGLLYVANKNSTAGLRVLEIAEDGTATYRAGIEPPQSGVRTDPLLSANGSRLFWHGGVYATPDQLLSNLGAPALATISDGRIAVGPENLYWSDTGAVAAPLSETFSVAAIDAGDRFLVGFDESSHSFHSLRLDSLVDLRTATPLPDAVIDPADFAGFEWPEVEGATSYHVFLGTSHEDIAAAESGDEIATTTTNRFAPAGPPPFGNRYFWRVDAVTPGGVVPGMIRSFTLAFPAVGSPMMFPDASTAVTPELSIGGAGLVAGYQDAATIYQIDRDTGLLAVDQTLPRLDALLWISFSAGVGDGWLVRPVPKSSSSSPAVRIVNYKREASGEWLEAGRILLPGTTDPGSDISQIAIDGNLGVLGQPGAYENHQGRILTFTEWPEPRLTGTLEPSPSLPGDGFGAAFSLDGDQLLVSAPGTPSSNASIFFFKFDPSTWTWKQQARLQPDGRIPGYGLALALSGSRAAVSTGYLSGQTAGVWLYRRLRDGNWIEDGIVSGPDDPPAGSFPGFGNAVAIDDGMLLVGNPEARVAGVTRGAVFSYRQNARGEWIPGATIPGPQDTKSFGTSIAIRNGVAYITSQQGTHGYRLREETPPAPRFLSPPPPLFMVGGTVDLPVPIEASGAGATVEAVVLPDGLRLGTGPDGLARLTGTPTATEGTSVFLRLKAVSSTGRVTFQSAQVDMVAAPQIDTQVQLVLNRQTGLYEQTLTITNVADREIAGFDLAITGLPAGVEVYNASACDDGIWCILRRQPLAVGASVTLILEYYVPVRGTAIAPEVAVSLVTESESAPAPTEPGLAVDRCEMLDDGLLIEFTATPGALYEVQYSDDNADWRVSPTRIRAAGNRVQWIDRGPPRTDSPPADKSSRFYRVRELSENG